MNTWLKRLTVAVLAAVMVLTMLGTAAAQGPGGGPGNLPPTGPRRPGAHILDLLLQRLHDKTGISLEDLQARRGENITLADLFRENGLDPEAIAAEVKAEITAEIAQAVADGRITQENADRMIAGLDEALDRAMNTAEALRVGVRGVAQRIRQARERAGELLSRSLVGTVADMSGTDVQAIMREWRDAGSLAAVIEAHGLSVDDVVSTTEAAITAKVNETVAEGKLSDEQAAQILDGLHDRLTERVNGAPLFPAVLSGAREQFGELVDMTLMGVIADMAGVQPRDLFTPPTLAEIAAENGVDAEAVVSEAEARITERVNQWVADGKLTDEQAAQILDGLHDRLTERLNQPMGQNMRRGGGPVGRPSNARPPAPQGAPAQQQGTSAN